jgi:hypothetical protein
MKDFKESKHIVDILKNIWVNMKGPKKLTVKYDILKKLWIKKKRSWRINDIKPENC